jgi:hypothetical protein
MTEATCAAPQLAGQAGADVGGLAVRLVYDAEALRPTDNWRWLAVLAYRSVQT